jgi:dolichyl-phosphate-mannose-protein mannosyltransferase
LGLLTRFYKIDAGSFVLWDEAHFGKFASYYLRREFYFDVHPPLGKMLVGLAGYLAGYSGDFEFKSGETYPVNINYNGMRMLLALFGVFAVPFTYLTGLELGFSRQAALLAALLLLLGTRVS